MSCRRDIFLTSIQSTNRWVCRAACRSLRAMGLRHHGHDMRVRGWRLPSLVLIALAASLMPAPASEITVPPVAEAFGQRLQLTGCGVREAWWHNLYLVSIYLPERTGDVEKILNTATEKAIRLDVLYDGRIPGALPASWRERLKGRLPAQVFQQVKGLYRRVARVGRGAVLFVAYHPNHGTVATVNGHEVLHDPGTRLINGLLDLWIGPHPESENLRRLLLQGVC